MMKTRYVENMAKLYLNFGTKTLKTFFLGLHFYLKYKVSELHLILVQVKKYHSWGQLKNKKLYIYYLSKFILKMIHKGDFNENNFILYTIKVR